MRTVSLLLPMLHHMVPHNDGNCHPTMPIIKRQGACDPLLETTKIRVVECSKSNSATMKHIYNKAANFIKTYVVHIGTSEPLNLTEMVPVISMGGMVSCACLHYNTILLDTGHIDGSMQEKCNSSALALEFRLPWTNLLMCRLINLAAMENWCPFLPKSSQPWCNWLFLTEIYHTTISSYHG